MKPLLLAVTLAVSAAAAPPLPGGFSDADPKSSEVKAAAAFAVKAAAAAAEKPESTDKAPAIQLKAIVAARQQVVAGINYQLHLRVRSNSTERDADATVWWQPWRRPDPFQLTAWKWRDAAAAGSDAAAEAKASPEKPPAQPR